MQAQDRTIYEDMIFAKMLMEQGLLEKRDFETYRALSENMANFMKRPNLIVHLDVSPEESLARIKSRYALYSFYHMSFHIQSNSFLYVECTLLCHPF
jgi:deoxyadenosine/deoxycytidine kinase